MEESSFGMRSILEAKSEHPFQKIKKLLTYDWIFVGYEKVIVSVAILWTVFSIGLWIWKFVLT
jgi:hypothetical protein